MKRGRVTVTELMPNRGGDYTERFVSKRKKGKGFLKPNSELEPNN